MFNSKNKVLRGAATMIAALALTAGAIANAHAQQTRTLSYASGSPPSNSGVANAVRWMAAEFEKRTNGELKVEIHWMGSLVHLRDAVDGVSSGVADMAYVIPAYSQAKMPLHYISSTGLGPGDQWVAQEAWSRMYEQVPELEEELERNNMVHLGHYSIGPAVFMGKNRPYFTPDDFKGDRFRLSSRFANAARLERWRVTPVNITFPDIYTGLERGTIDGAVTYLNQIVPYRHNEVAKHVTMPNLGQQMNIVVMNRRVWNSLTAQQQEAIRGIMAEFQIIAARGELEDQQRSRQELENDPRYPMTFYEINEEQRAVWAKNLEAAEEENVARTERRHPTARRLYEAFMAELEKVDAERREKGYPWERE